MNNHITHDIASKISDLYATECWLSQLEDALATSTHRDSHYHAWKRLIDASESRREMLRHMAKLENCRISFDLILPKGVFSYDFAGLSAEVSGNTGPAARTAKNLDGLSRHLILEYLHLLNMAQQNGVFSVIMAVDCILETMPHDYERFLHQQHYRHSA